MSRSKKSLGTRLSNLRKLAQARQLSGSTKGENVPCIHILRDPHTKRVTNVVRNPNSPQFLKEVGSWEMDCEYLTEEEYSNLPTCRVCGRWVELCNGVHVFKEPAALMASIVIG